MDVRRSRALPAVNEPPPPPPHLGTNFVGPPAPASDAAVDGSGPSAPIYHDDVVALLSRSADQCIVVVNAHDLVNPVFLPERAVVLNAEQPYSPSARSYADAIVEGVRRCPGRD